MGEQCSLRVNVLDAKLRCVGLDLSQLIETLWVENLLFKKTGQGFEDFFSDTAKLHWGEDFEPWKPQGSLGDFKCDGYRVSEKRVFQCYAPKQAEPSKTATKIKTDFEGAKKHFENRMESWVLVYNQSEMPAGCGKLIGDLREANPNIKINVWLHIDLHRFALNLSPEDLAFLLPNWQKDVKMDGALINAMSELVNANTVANPPAESAAAGTNQVTLIQALDHLSDDDRAIRVRLLAYSKWLDPLGKEQASALLVEKGFVSASVELNLDMLHQKGLLNVTAKHVLPLDDQICSEAADEMADEFFALLEEL